MNHITSTYIVTNFILAIIFLQCSTSAPYLQMMCFMLSQEWAIFFFLTVRIEHSSKAFWLERTNILLSWESIVSSVSDSSAFLVLPAQDLMWQVKWPYVTRDFILGTLSENTCRTRYSHTHTHMCVSNFLQQGCLISSPPAKTDFTVFGKQHSDFNLHWYDRCLRIQPLLFP